MGNQGGHDGGGSGHDSGSNNRGNDVPMGHEERYGFGKDSNFSSGGFTISGQKESRDHDGKDFHPTAVPCAGKFIGKIAKNAIVAAVEDVATSGVKKYNEDNHKRGSWESFGRDVASYCGKGVTTALEIGEICAHAKRDYFDSKISEYEDAGLSNDEAVKQAARDLDGDPYM